MFLCSHPSLSLFRHQYTILPLIQLIYTHHRDIACGVLYKYDDTTANVTQLLKCSGIIGPEGKDANYGIPSDMTRRSEGGSNGLYWSSDGNDILYMNQHGWKRIVQLNVNDINEEESTIDPTLVTVVADTYNSSLLNSPNDMVEGEDGYLYFTDPPFGLQYKDVDDPFAYSFQMMTQDKPAVYRTKRINQNPVLVETERLLEFEVAEEPSERFGPNGIALTGNGDLAVAFTDWNNPRTHIYSPGENSTFNPEPTAVLLHEYRIEGKNAAYPPLTDGITYDPDRRVLFISGPGGIYIYEAFDEYDLLGFLRIDDLVSNNVVGGGYLWITANQRLLRVPLAEVVGTETDTSSSTVEVEEDISATAVEEEEVEEEVIEEGGDDETKAGDTSAGHHSSLSPFFLSYSMLILLWLR